MFENDIMYNIAILYFTITCVQLTPCLALDADTLSPEVIDLIRQVTKDAVSDLETRLKVIYILHKSNNGSEYYDNSAVTPSSRPCCVYTASKDAVLEPLWTPWGRNEKA